MQRLSERKRKIRRRELLAAIIIVSALAAVLLPLLGRLVLGSDNNAEKKIRENLAELALGYLEQQDYARIRDFFAGGQGELKADACLGQSGCEAYRELTDNPSAMAAVLNPVVNGRVYRVNVVYLAERHRNMKATAPYVRRLRKPDAGAERALDYFLPVSVQVSGPDGAGTTRMEGVLIHD